MTPRLAEALAPVTDEELRQWEYVLTGEDGAYKILGRLAELRLIAEVKRMRAAAEPEAKDDPCAGMECVVCNTTDGNINTCEGCKDNVCEDHTERDDDNIPLCEDCMTASETDAAVSP